jgi:hypothetical protein
MRKFDGKQVSVCREQIPSVNYDREAKFSPLIPEVSID